MKASEAKKTAIYKTVEGMEMPPAIKKKILKGIIDAAKMEKKTNFQKYDSYIDRAFDWSETKEGHTFWMRVYFKYFVKINL
jgi:hypothetical protein